MSGEFPNLRWQRSESITLNTVVQGGGSSLSEAARDAALGGCSSMTRMTGRLPVAASFLTG
jgi:hypothetical protein